MQIKLINKFNFAYQINYYNQSMYKGYCKIPETSSELKITNPKIIKHWYVTEKVHGSCFCFIYDLNTNSIKCAKTKTNFD